MLEIVSEMLQTLSWKLRGHSPMLARIDVMLARIHAMLAWIDAMLARIHAACRQAHREALWVRAEAPGEHRGIENLTPRLSEVTFGQAKVTSRVPHGAFR